MCTISVNSNSLLTLHFYFVKSFALQLLYNVASYVFIMRAAHTEIETYVYKKWHLSKRSMSAKYFTFQALYIGFVHPSLREACEPLPKFQKRRIAIDILDYSIRVLELQKPNITRLRKAKPSN